MSNFNLPLFVLSQKLSYNFEIENQVPIDKRFVVQSLTALHPQNRRYAGLIFYNIEDQQLYVYNDNLQPTLLSGYVLSVNGINGNDYSILDAHRTLGKMITIFPLGITVVYNGTDWQYHSGIYHTNDDFDTIPTNLLKSGVLVINETYDESFTEHVINPDLTLSNYVLLFTNEALINKRFYTKNDGNLYYALNDVLYQIGNKRELINHNLKFENVINHNLNSTYIEMHIFIEVNGIAQVIPILEKSVTLNSVTFKSQLEIDNVVLLITTI